MHYFYGRHPVRRRTVLGGSCIDKVLGYSPIAYWPLNEASGATAVCQVSSAQNGTYTGVTLANELGPDGVNYAPFFDGVNDLVNIYSVPFRDAFNGAEGSVVVWGRINPGAWTDGAERFLLRFRVDDNNRVDIGKAAANNQLFYNYSAGGTHSARYPAVSETPFFCAVITWSALADEMWPYLNGTPIAAVRNGLGVWAGTFNSNTTILGASNIWAGNPWHGWGAHCIAFDRPLTPAEVLSVSTI